MSVPTKPLSRRFLSREFDRLYAEAVEVLKRLNPCNIRVDDTTKELVCAGRGGWAARDSTLCCTGCSHLHPKRGCTVKALYCRTWLCGAKVHADSEARIALTKIQDEARRLNLLVSRGTKKQAIDNAVRAQRSIPIWLSTH